jgi:hypothetical protein
MSYYILPKKNNILHITPDIKLNNNNNYYISHSLFHYLNKQLNEVESLNNDFLKMINPYEFLFSKVPSYKISVSKLRPPSHTFYILMELAHIFNLFDSFSKKNITTMHFSSCPEATIECMDMMREEMHDIHLAIDLFSCLNNIQTSYLHNVDFMYFDINLEIYKDDTLTQSYLHTIISILLNIFIYQSRNGITIIKIGNIFHKVILDIIFLLTSLFEKVYIIKPNTSNIFSNEKFIVCKFFEYSFYENNIYIDNLKKILIREQNFLLSSLIEEDLPYYFLNKIEEANAIIGQQQLEAIDNVINIIKNKNKDEKIETLKKINIQKCIQMCEKFKIPYNKFTDKVNIFLQPQLEENLILQNIFLNPLQNLEKINNEYNFTDDSLINILNEIIEKIEKIE